MKMRAALGLAVLVAAISVVMVDRVSADNPLNAMEVCKIDCPPNWLPAAPINCGTGFRAARIQNRSTTSVYFGAGTNFTGANRTYGQEHCSTCADGPRFSADMNYGKLKCFSDTVTSDAGTPVYVLSGQ